jgi:hypothetical protein
MMTVRNVFFQSSKVGRSTSKAVFHRETCPRRVWIIIPPNGSNHPRSKQLSSGYPTLQRGNQRLRRNSRPRRCLLLRRRRFKPNTLCNSLRIGNLLLPITANPRQIPARNTILQGDEFVGQWKRTAARCADSSSRAGLTYRERSNGKSGDTGTYSASSPLEGTRGLAPLINTRLILTGTSH